MINILVAIGSTISGLFAYFLLLFSRKGLVATASLAAVVATTGTVILCFKAIVDAVLSLALMPSWMVMGLGAIIPGNFIQVLAYICSGYMCKAVYEVLGEQIRLVNNAN